MQIIFAAGATWCEIFCWIYPKIYLFLLIANISSKYFIRTFQQNVTSKCKTAAPVQIILAAGATWCEIFWWVSFYADIYFIQIYLQMISPNYDGKTFQQNITSKCKTAALVQIIWAAGATWWGMFCWIYPKMYLFMLMANILSKYFIQTFQQNTTSK